MPRNEAFGASCVADLPVVLASVGWLAVAGLQQLAQQFLPVSEVFLLNIYIYNYIYIYMSLTWFPYCCRKFHNERTFDLSVLTGFVGLVAGGALLLRIRPCNDDLQQHPGRDGDDFHGKPGSVDRHGRCHQVDSWFQLLFCLSAVVVHPIKTEVLSISYEGAWAIWRLSQN